GVLSRRWYVCVPLLLAVAAGMAALYPRLTLSYAADGSLVLLPPPSQAQMVQNKRALLPSNPLLTTTPSMEMAAQILVDDVTSNAEEDALVAASGMHSFTVTVDGHAPVITVDTTASTAGAALMGVKVVLARMQG